MVAKLSLNQSTAAAMTGAASASSLSLARSTRISRSRLCLASSTSYAFPSVPSPSSLSGGPTRLLSMRAGTGDARPASSVGWSVCSSSRLPKPADRLTGCAARCGGTGPAGPHYYLSAHWRLDAPARLHSARVCGVVNC